VARDLFYWQGICATGVDRIAAEAQVAPTTLYRLFGSKDDLVAAYVERENVGFQQWFTAAVTAGADDARGRILAVFDALTEQVQPGSCRGCPFLMVLAEVPDEQSAAHRRAVANKRWVRDQFAQLAAGLEVADPGALGDQLALVLDGVYGSVQALGAAGPARGVSELVARLID
jgi:AcrR family transcriptional regulator